MANRDELLAALGFASYRDYLQSDHWYWFRKRITAKHRHCEICRKQGYVVHHKTYERVGCELPTDVVVLCGRCHDCLHGVHSKKHIPLHRFDDAVKVLRRSRKWKQWNLGAANPKQPQALAAPVQSLLTAEDANKMAMRSGWQDDPRKGSPSSPPKRTASIDLLSRVEQLERELGG